MVSSTLGLMGMIGYSQYAPTKFALRGLAECLRQELLPYGIGVSIYFVSTIKTPGYERENLTKPAITKLIEDGDCSDQSPEARASTLLKGTTRGDEQCATLLRRSRKKAVFHHIRHTDRHFPRPWLRDFAMERPLGSRVQCCGTGTCCARRIVSCTVCICSLRFPCGEDMPTFLSSESIASKNKRLAMACCRHCLGPCRKLVIVSACFTPRVSPEGCCPLRPVARTLPCLY